MLIDGSLPQPSETNPSFTSCTWANNIVMSSLYNSISKDIFTSILFATTVCEIWEALHTPKMSLAFFNVSDNLCPSNKVLIELVPITYNLNLYGKNHLDTNPTSHVHAVAFNNYNTILILSM